jgi:macrodomain Ter protein organizer (MatP/YcbG family)
VSATVRKNFVLDAKVAQHLEELAKENNQSMTSLVEEMVEERYGSIKVKKRMKALENMREFARNEGRGLLLGKSIQSIKAEMDV